MKTIGLLGGMSWESTLPYYRIVNQTIGRELGGLHSAKILLYSVDFHEIEILQHGGDWETAGAILAEAARRLETAGADFLVLCTNTMHKVAPAIQREIQIPLLHIADATADAIRQAGIETVGLLGTRFTMEESFYRERLEEKGLRVIVPDAADRERAHRVIYDELCLGRSSRSRGPPMSGSWAASSKRVPKGSSWAVRRSACSSGRRIHPCPSSTPPRSTRVPRRWRR